MQRWEHKCATKPSRPHDTHHTHRGHSLVDCLQAAMTKSPQQNSTYRKGGGSARVTRGKGGRRAEARRGKGGGTAQATRARGGGGTRSTHGRGGGSAQGRVQSRRAANGRATRAEEDSGLWSSCPEGQQQQQQQENTRAECSNKLTLQARNGQKRLVLHIFDIVQKYWIGNAAKKQN